MALSLTAAHPYLSLTDGGYYFRVTGTGFVSGLTFTIGGVAGTVGYVEYSTTFWGYTPANPAGVYDLVVTLPDTQTATLTNAFTYVDNTAGYVPPGTPEGAIIPRRIEDLSPDTEFAAPLKPNTLFWFVDNAGDAIVYGCVLSYVHKGEGAFAATDQWTSLSPTYFRFNNAGAYYVAFRLDFRQYAYGTLRPSGCADLVLSNDPLLHRARAITLAAETMGILIPDARASTLSTEIVSAGVPIARAVSLVVEVISAWIPPVNRAVYPFMGNMVFTGHIPLITGLPPAPYSREFCLDVTPANTALPTPQVAADPIPPEE